MRSWVAVAIGIKHTGHLNEFPGAIKGAKEFIDWVKDQGDATYLVTDVEYTQSR